MPLSGWPDCPASAHDQVSGLVESVQLLPGNALVGIYLHGSLAYGCFNPERSDIDLLVVTARPLLPDSKLGLIQSCLRRSTHPAPLELSVLTRTELLPWQYPTPFQLHYSEAGREPLAADTISLAWLAWPAGQQGSDPDLAAHLTLTRARGIALAGPQPAEFFPAVPPADYLAAIVADSEAALTVPLADPASTVLNLCRVAWYLRAQVLSSKEEAGAWAHDSVPPAQRELVSQALAVYRGTQATASWEVEGLRRFGHEVLGLAATGPHRPESGPAQQLPLSGER